MIVINKQKQIADISDPQLQRLVELRIQGIEECCPWDANELGPMIVIEPGDTANDLEMVMGFSILEGQLDESHFGDEEFSPCFEFAESHGDQLFELVYIVNDGGYHQLNALHLSGRFHLAQYWAQIGREMLVLQ